jgi:hypothetical protein
MYICNLEKMKKHIGGYLENFKEEVKEADKRQKLDKETQCICNLEMNFTEEILKLIDKYISKTKEL